MSSAAQTGTDRKTDRIESRVTPAAKAAIQRASALSGLTAGDLAYEGAQRVIAFHETMVLTGANAEAFLQALDAPVEAPPKLVEALRRYREVVAD